MPKACCSSYNLAFKPKVVAEAEAVENNSEITRDNGSLLAKRVSEPLQWELKMSAKQKTMGCYSRKYPELDSNTGLVFRAAKSR